MEEKNDKLSIMIVPKTRKVRRITIPNWLPKSTLIGAIIILLVTTFFFGQKNNRNSNLEKDNKNQVEQIAYLEKRKTELQNLINKKDNTILELRLKNEDLDNKVNEIEAKLNQIDKLKEELEKMANTN